ncbi:MAG: hypothetical protein JKY50_04160 [Oleispira sp.]|nr:hypothetical protein [Oleispira sp.]
MKKVMKKAMNKMRLLMGLVAVLMLVLVLALVVGYHGGERLSGEEVEHYLSIIEGQDQEPGGRHDLTALRDFLEKDDGQPFYTVNLYRFHAEAQYLPGSEYSNGSVGGAGKEAFERFSKVMIKLLARHSSHPIFASNWAHDESSNWEKLVIVRYKSRRDIAELFASNEFADANEHKWAALAANERMLVQGLHIPSFYIIALIMILLVWLFYLVLKPKNEYSS